MNKEQINTIISDIELSLRDDFHSGITKVDCESEIFGYPVVSIPYLFAKENAHKLNKNIDVL